MNFCARREKVKGAGEVPSDNLITSENTTLQRLVKHVTTGYKTNNIREWRALTILQLEFSKCLQNRRIWPNQEVAYVVSWTSTSKIGVGGDENGKGDSWGFGWKEMKCFVKTWKWSYCLSYAIIRFKFLEKFTHPTLGWQLNVQRRCFTPMTYCILSFPEHLWFTKKWPNCFL